MKKPWRASLTQLVTGMPLSSTMENMIERIIYLEQMVDKLQAKRDG